MPLAALLGGVFVLLAAVGGGVVAMGSGGGARVAVEQALAAKDYGLALQRAATNLTVRPNDADAVALVREAVHAEVRALIAAGRVEDARKRVLDHRAAFTWLDTGVLDGEIAIASAMWLATHHQEKEAVAAFAKLRQDGVDAKALDRAMVDSLIDSNRPAEAIGAAWRLAEGSQGGLDANVLKLLTYALTWEGPFGDSMKELRTLLRTRHPPIVDTVRPWLDEADYEKRFNAFLLLTEAGKLGDPEIIRFHVRTVLTLTSSYTATTEAVTWLAAEAAKPGWDERKKAAALPPVGDVPPLLKSWNEAADQFIAMAAVALVPEIEDKAVAWSNDEDENLRWNALKLLIAAKRVARIDVPAFHAKTLTTFNPLYESAPFTAALTFFSAKAGSADAPAAKQVLLDSIKHVQKQIDQYEKAGGNFMQMRANTCKERWQQISGALSKF